MSMSEPDAESTPQPGLVVDWPTCVVGACRGVRVGSGDRCWAHLSAVALKDALASLEPGGELDLRGTSLGKALFGKIQGAVWDPGDRRLRIGDAHFEGATFDCKVSFAGAVFSGRTLFDYVVFRDSVSFQRATFEHYVAFHNAKFSGFANFERAKFAQATFAYSAFTEATFEDARFGGLVEVRDASFSGSAMFTGAVAEYHASFVRTKFSEAAHFDKMIFRKQASFGGIEFGWDARFEETKFGGRADFCELMFPDDTMFVETEFKDRAWFQGVKFAGDAFFYKATFGQGAWFEGADVGGNASFSEARFQGKADFTGVHVAGRLWLESLEAGGELALEDSRGDGGEKVRCVRAEFRGRVWFRLSGGELWLDDSAFAGPVTVESALGREPGAHIPAGGSSGAAASVRLRSLKGTDAEHLTLVDVDMSRCELAGLRRPELLRLVGRCEFALMPRGWCLRWGWLPWRWTAREALFEEHLWRRSVGAPAPGMGWAAPDPGEETVVVGPERLAVMYRQVRAVLEHARNEPGAADLYYGEMEMRRAAARWSVRWGERWLLGGYWLVSGYGLRAGRSLLGLAGLILAAGVALKYAGFPEVIPGYPECVLYAAGSVVSLDLASRNLPSVLTEWGDVVRIVLRVGGPVLLGLAVLAVRGRMKR
jgi:uncharacterized protein YjbI with pentapeptide repeats